MHGDFEEGLLSGGTRSCGGRRTRGRSKESSETWRGKNANGSSVQEVKLQEEDEGDDELQGLGLTRTS